MLFKGIYYACANLIETDYIPQTQLPADRDLAVPQKARIYQGEDYVFDELEGHAERFLKHFLFDGSRKPSITLLSKQTRQEYEALHFTSEQKGDLTLLRLANIGDSLLLLQNLFETQDHRIIAILFKNHDHNRTEYNRFSLILSSTD